MCDGAWTLMGFGLETLSVFFPAPGCLTEMFAQKGEGI